MSAAESNIQLYGTLSTICLVIAILAFLLAAFFFFYFDIPTVFALKTGRAKKKTLERIQKQNSYTDKIRSDTDNVGVSATVQEPQPSQPAIVYPQDSRGNRDVDTAMLNDNAETSLLSSETETSLLSQTDPQTSLLSGVTGALGGAKPADRIAAMNINWHFDLNEEIIMIHTDELI